MAMLIEIISKVIQLLKSFTNCLALGNRMTSNMQVLDGGCTLIWEVSADVIQGAPHACPSSATTDRSTTTTTTTTFLQQKWIRTLISETNNPFLDILLDGGSVHRRRSKAPCPTASRLADSLVGLQNLRRCLRAAHKIVVASGASILDRKQLSRLI